MRRFAGLLLLAAWAWGCATAETATPPREILHWHDPMHPEYTSDRPGKAPDCGMDLVPVYADEAKAKPAASPSPAGDAVQLGRVERGSAARALKTVGRIVPDENRVYPVIAGCEGWITKVGAATGDRVRRGQPLATVYGREYSSAQRAFLYALRAAENPPPALPGEEGLPVFSLEEARRYLQNLGIGDEQIHDLETTRKVTLDIVLTAPVSGVILSRTAYPRQRFDRDVELFRIADLSRVWVIAELPTDGPADVAPGTVVRLSSPGRPSGTAVVSGALPRFDAASRRAKLRLEADNPGLALRPDMLVDVEFPVVVHDVTTVPSSAVVQTDGVATVFVDRGDGRFEPRQVEIGRDFGDRVEIARGVAPGETIAVTGAFHLLAEQRGRP